MPNPENSSKHEQKKNDVIAFIAESKVQWLKGTCDRLLSQLMALSSMNWEVPLLK